MYYSVVPLSHHIHAHNNPERYHGLNYMNLLPPLSYPWNSVSDRQMRMNGIDRLESLVCL